MRLHAALVTTSSMNMSKKVTLVESHWLPVCPSLVSGGW
jgi:hypothetical protein